MPLREIFRASEPSDVEAAQRRLAIAQALQQRSLQPTIVQNHGPVASKYGAGNALVDLASAMFANANLQKADKAYARAKDAKSAELSKAIQGLQSATPDAQVGAQALENIRAAPDDQLAQPVTSQSEAVSGVAKALGPEAQQQIATAMLAQKMAPPKYERADLGDSIGLLDQQGNVVKRIPKGAVPKAPEADKPLDELAKLTADFKAGRISQPDYDARRSLMTTRASNAAPAGQGFDDPEIQDLQAAISASGYSLPVGFCSKEQQLALLKGLKRKYEGLSNDDIAHLIGSNAIDYKATTKATQTAASIVGKVEVANNELAAFVPIAKEANAAVDRSKFVPWNKLEQMGKKSISDPDLKRLYVATQTILNAYDMLAARGGTDQDKRAHNREILATADSPEAYEAALDMIVREGQAAGVAARKATKASEYEDHPGKTPPAAPAPTNAKGWILHTDKNGNKAYVSPDGKQYEEVK